MNIVWSFASSIFWGLGRLDPIYCFWIYFFAPLPDLENNIPIFPVFQIPIFYNIDNSSYVWSLHDWAYEESLHGHSDPPSSPSPRQDNVHAALHRLHHGRAHLHHHHHRDHQVLRIIVMLMMIATASDKTIIMMMAFLWTLQWRGLFTCLMSLEKRLATKIVYCPVLTPGHI